MTSRTRDIKVHVRQNGSERTFETYAHEYRSLMALIHDKVYIESFGDCKGIGRCGTCHVHVLSDHEDLLKREGNETTTLNKMPVITGRSRLACQILVDERIHGLWVEIVDDEELGLY